ncbi:MAG: hypothetical protein WC710_15375, partial [Gallionella sp.]
MIILNSGSSDTFTLNAWEQLTVTSRGGTTVTGPSGLLGTVSGTSTFGGYSADTVITISSVMNDCQYGVTEPENAQSSTDANNNSVIVVGSANYAALPIDANNKAILIGGGGHLRDTTAARGGLGDTLMVFNIAAAANTSSSRITDLSVIAPDPDYGAYVAQFDGTGTAGTIYDHTPAAAVSMTDVNSIGFWAMSPV